MSKCTVEGILRWHHILDNFSWSINYKAEVMDGWSWMTAWAVFLLTVITDVLCVECYTCAYVPGAKSDESCSDPWTWTRSRFNLFTGPPKRTCDEACVKTVIAKPGQWSAVLRNCGPACNETRIGSTLTTCCDTDLCNAAPSSTHQPMHLWTAVTVVSLSFLCRTLILR